MTRLLSIFLLPFGLVWSLAPLSLAAEPAQKPLIKIYRAPG